MTDDFAPDDHHSGSAPSRRQVLFAGAGALAAVLLAACGGGDSTTATPGTTGAPGTTGGPATTAQGRRHRRRGDDIGRSGDARAHAILRRRRRAHARPDRGAVLQGQLAPAGRPPPGAGGGTPLNLSGTVVTTGCQQVNAAKIEFWQADTNGEYDNSGYTLRGHQFTDTQGRYALQTVVPGLYPGRTRHIHVMVQAPNGKVLTTQLYFPGEAGNASDGIYRSECLIDMNGQEGTFSFVLDG